MAFIPQVLSFLFIVVVLATLVNVNATKVRVKVYANKRNLRSSNQDTLVSISNSYTNNKLSSNKNVLSSKLTAENYQKAERASSPYYMKKQSSISESVQQYVSSVVANK
jgi:hypothetical protein